MADPGDVQTGYPDGEHARKKTCHHKAVKRKPSARVIGSQIEDHPMRIKSAETKENCQEMQTASQGHATVNCQGEGTGVARTGEELDDLMILQVQFGDAHSPCRSELSSEGHVEDKQTGDLVGKRVSNHTSLSPANQWMQLSIGHTAFKMWSDIGVSQGLTSDPDIALFLLQHYEKTQRLRHPGTECSICLQPLTLFCLHCNQPQSLTVPAPSQPKGRRKGKKRNQRTLRKSRVTSSASKYDASLGDCISVRDDVETCFNSDPSDDAVGDEGVGISIDCMDDDSSDGQVVQGQMEDVESTTDDSVQRSRVTTSSAHHLITSSAASTKREPPEEPVMGKLCQVCGKNFRSLGSYRIHIRSKHGLGKAAPHVCPICQKNFYSIDDFRAHVNSHSGAKPFTCEKCRMSYSSHRGLKKHACGNKKQFSCEICGRMFAKKDYLREHQRMHSATLQYQCQTCMRSFKYRTSVAKHQRKCQLNVTSAVL